MTEPAVQGEQQSISANAPAWTPGGVATNISSPVAPPRDEKVEDTCAASETAAPETKGGGEVGDSSSVTASETGAPEKKGGGEIGDNRIVPVEPTVPADELNP